MLDVVDHRLHSANRVRELCLCRPPVNAFDLALLTALDRAIAEAEATGIRALVLSGRDGVFSAGLDIRHAARQTETELDRTFGALRSVVRTIGHSTIPIACAITGPCMGAGAIFALFCDYRVMDRRRGRFGITEVRGGLAIGRHVIEALGRIVGAHTAQKLILGARVLDPPEACRLGIADELAGPPLVVSRAVAWCDRALAMPSEAMLATRNAARAALHERLREVDAEPTGAGVPSAAPTPARLGKLLAP